MILSADTERKIEQVIAQQGVLRGDQLELAKIDALKQNKSLLQLLVDRGTINDELATKIIAMGSNLPFVDLSKISIPTETLSIIPREIAQS